MLLDFISCIISCDIEKILSIEKENVIIRLKNLIELISILIFAHIIIKKNIIKSINFFNI